MTIPISDERAAPLLAEVSQDLLRVELKGLDDLSRDAEKFRSYFNGEQELVYSTELFTKLFGDAFEGFKDNWMRPIVEVVLDRLTIAGLKAAPDASDTDADTVAAVWDVFLDNDIDEQADELIEGMLVEGIAHVIVWPDSELGARIDWQPAGTCAIRYDTEDTRRPLWAVKRWITDTNQINVTVYTDDFVYKFFLQEENEAQGTPSTDDKRALIPPFARGMEGLQIREVTFVNDNGEIEVEPWPLPNPFGTIPVVEFVNTAYRSEIADAIPRQDALNKVLVDMLIAGEFYAVPQRYTETTQAEPLGGWNVGAAEIMQFRPGLDPDGRPIRGQFGAFPVGDPSTFLKVIDNFRQAIGLNSRTPVRYFTQSDRGGRGDAPSGDSLKIEDQPLNDKVKRKAKWAGNRFIRVARLVAQAIDADVEALRRAEVQWHDPRMDDRKALLEEAVLALTAGFPFAWVVQQMGLDQTEADTLIELKEEEDQKRQEEQLTLMEARSNSFGNEESNSDSGPPSESNTE